MKMPKLMKAKWLAALRSGEYDQGRSCLRTLDGKYCCLGVLQMVCDGDVEKWEHGGVRGLPAVEWYASHGIEGATRGPLGPSDMSVPLRLSLMNDGCNDSCYPEDHADPKTFLEIADYIDKNVEGY